ncbi:hypothetical protein D3C75_1251020 [compost metagenome]
MDKKVNKPTYEFISGTCIIESFNGGIPSDYFKAVGRLIAASITPVPRPPTSGIAFYTGGGEDE